LTSSQLELACYGFRFLKTKGKVTVMQAKDAPASSGTAATDAMERERSTYDAVAERYADAMVNELHERPLERSMPSCSR
jgi:hypothetical protein